MLSDPVYLHLLALTTSHVLSLLCVAGHRGLSVAAALTVVNVALLGCDHYSQSWLCFELIMVQEKWTSYFCYFKLKPLNWDWTWQFKHFPHVWAGTSEGRAKRAFLDSKWLLHIEVDCLFWGACLVDLHETGCNFALWSAKVFVSHYTTLFHGMQMHLWMLLMFCILSSPREGAWICNSLKLLELAFLVFSFCLFLWHLTV